jgi:two-component system OmpR family response regulator
MQAYGKILIVEDDPDVRELVRKTLEGHGYEVTATDDVDAVPALVASLPADLVVLDVMLPKKDGLTICGELRRQTTCPILMLSARSTDVDRILGIEVGADDYLTKPFNPQELATRVRGLLRRVRVYDTPAATPLGAEEVLTHRNLRMFPQRRRVECDGKEIKLTPVEFALLKAFLHHPGITLTRQQLLDHAWGPEHEGEERTIDNHIRNLRVRLQSAAPNLQFISSVWRVGYRLDA